MVGKTATRALAERFPHLEGEIDYLFKRNPDFSQLCDDYELLICTLSGRSLKEDQEREELIALKGSLEFEVLELLSQVRHAD